MPSCSIQLHYLEYTVYHHHSTPSTHTHTLFTHTPTHLIGRGYWLSTSVQESYSWSWALIRLVYTIHSGVATIRYSSALKRLMTLWRMTQTDSESSCRRGMYDILCFSYLNYLVFLFSYTQFGATGTCHQQAGWSWATLLGLWQRILAGGQQSRFTNACLNRV